MRVVDEVHQRHQVGHAPGPGHQAGGLQLDRMVGRVVLDIGVHAVDIALEEGARGGVELQRVAVAIAPQAQHAHADVAGQRIGAEGGRQFTAPGGAKQLHLHQPVLRRDEALGAQQVGRVGREDVGNAEFVAQHLDRRREAGQLQVAIHLGVAGGAHHQVAAQRLR